MKLTKSEKARRWLDLCDFTYNLLKNALTPKQFKLKMEKIRKEHLKDDRRLLMALGRLGNK